MRRLILFTLLVAWPSAALSQQIYGRLEGAANDAQGLVLPGVTVTLESAELVAPRVATTDVDGSYRFAQLVGGSYNMTFELGGFQTVVFEDITVVGGSTFEINATMDIATVAETVTVTGESPVVDVKTTGVSATFDTTQLEDVPSATDMWAVLQQSPGVRMRGYDVGGSHKSQQSGYETFGVRGQNRIINDGVNTTEGTGGAGGYYDFYAIGEFQVSAQGADVESNTPGATVNAVWKSGGNDFSGTEHFAYEPPDMIADNLPSELASRGGTTAPVIEFYEAHIDLGGPIVRDKAWFYAAYNRFVIDRIISGVPEDQATDLGDFDMFTVKANWQITDRDQFITFHHWSLKQKPFRGLSAVRPAESILAQDSWSWLHKAEWQRVWSDRLYSNIQVNHFGFGWPMTPAVDPATKPARIDLGTGQWSGAGWRPVHLQPVEAAHDGSVQLLPADGEREPRPEVRLGLADRRAAVRLERQLGRRPLPRRQHEGPAESDERGPDRVPQLPQLQLRPEHPPGPVRAGRVDHQRPSDGQRRLPFRESADGLPGVQQHSGWTL